MSKLAYLNKAGEKVPSVTTVLGGNLGWSKESLMAWANKIGREGKSLHAERNKLADAGSLAHLMASCDILNQPQPDLSEYDEETRTSALACYASYQKWRTAHPIRLIASEVRLVSEEHQFGGTLDALAIDNGELVLFDWKSARALYQETILQVAAYEIAWDENNPDMPIGSVQVLRWRPDGAQQHVIKFEDRANAWEAFKLLLQLNKLKPMIRVAA